MAEMYNPAHPGEIVREECLKSLGLTVTAAADALGVTRKVLSDLLNGHAGVSTEMAIRLEKVFGTRRIPGSGCRCSMTFGKAMPRHASPTSPIGVASPPPRPAPIEGAGKRYQRVKRSPPP
jgi:addiction module HigA family antidote